MMRIIEETLKDMGKDSEFMAGFKVTEKESTMFELMEKLKELQHDIVEENKSVTLFEKLNNNESFEPVMNRFIDKMMKDHILGRYFLNMKMKHMIRNKIRLFFAYSQGIMPPGDQVSLKQYHQHLKVTQEDFERSIIFFKEAMYEYNIDPATVIEAVDFYKSLRRHLVYDPEDNLEEIKREHLIYEQEKKSSFNNLQGAAPYLGPMNSEGKPQGKIKIIVEKEESQKVENPILKYMVGGPQNLNESENHISSFKLESESQQQMSPNGTPINREEAKC